MLAGKATERIIERIKSVWYGLCYNISHPSAFKDDIKAQVYKNNILQAPSKVKYNSHKIKNRDPKHLGYCSDMSQHCTDLVGLFLSNQE